MRAFEERLPERALNNFHFVSHQQVLAHTQAAAPSSDAAEADLALSAFLHLPDIYAKAVQLGYLGHCKAHNVTKVRVYSPFDSHSTGRLRPLDTTADSAFSGALHGGSNNPLFAT